MSKLWIGNTTKKTQRFMYRKVEDNRRDPLWIDIKPGGQVCLPFDLSTPDIESIVQTYAPYGLIPASEVSRTKPFVGMCWSIDKMVSLEILQLGLRHNDVLLDAQGREIRQLAAVALSNSLGVEGPETAIEVSVEEEKPDEHRGEGDALGRETIVVTKATNPDGSPKAGTKAAARGKRRAA